MTMDGPFKLLQGINGLVARKPIYQDGVFWGFVSVGVNLDQLLVEAGIKNGDTGDLQISIRNPGEPAFYGDDAIFQENPMIATIEHTDMKWELAALPQASAVQSIKQQIILIRCSFMLVLLIGLILYPLYP